jgi:hypothetical protein
VWYERWIPACAGRAARAATEAIAAAMAAITASFFILVPFIRGFLAKAKTPF